MRYPLWAFLFAFVLPPFALHAALVGKAGFDARPAPVERIEAARLPETNTIPVSRHAF